MRTGKTKILNLPGWLWASLAAFAFSACAMQGGMRASATAPANGAPAVAPYQQLATGGDLAVREQVTNVFGG
ncbi:MAG TPA: hypothetical protein VKV28_01660 [Candidatus Binataceae bacterium]|nr:hypothetical protein [Candidatus Binataceae bacterium]